MTVCVCFCLWQIYRWRWKFNQNVPFREIFMISLWQESYPGWKYLLVYTYYTIGYTFLLTSEIVFVHVSWIMRACGPDIREIPVGSYECKSVLLVCFKKELNNKEFNRKWNRYSLLNTRIHINLHECNIIIYLPVSPLCGRL